MVQIHLLVKLNVRVTVHLTFQDKLFVDMIPLNLSFKQNNWYYIRTKISHQLFSAATKFLV